MMKIISKQIPQKTVCITFHSLPHIKFECVLGTLQFTRELSNKTRASGKDITLRCEVKQLETNLTKTKVQFKWYQNYAEIMKNEKFKIGTSKVRKRVRTNEK